MSANFFSDNQAPVAPQIMAALLRANQGRSASYGADEITTGLKARFAGVFETDVVCFRWLRELRPTRWR